MVVELPGKMNKLFSIAEIGINHNGDLKIAKEMISRAKNCGFNSVKFQKRTIDLVYSKEIFFTNALCVQYFHLIQFCSHRNEPTALAAIY